MPPTIVLNGDPAARAVQVDLEGAGKDRVYFEGLTELSPTRFTAIAGGVTLVVTHNMVDALLRGDVLSGTYLSGTRPSTATD